MRRLSPPQIKPTNKTHIITLFRLHPLVMSRKRSIKRGESDRMHESSASIHQLPDELIRIVLLYMDRKTFITSRAVCRRFYFTSLCLFEHQVESLCVCVCFSKHNNTFRIDNTHAHTHTVSIHMEYRSQCHSIAAQTDEQKSSPRCGQ